MPTKSQLEDSISELRARSIQLQTILDTANIIILAHDKKWRIVYMNHYACKKLGYKDGELIGKDIRPLLDQSEFDKANDIRDDISVEPNLHIEGFEQYWKTRDGGSILIKWNVSALLNENNEAIGFLGVGQDITYKRAFEKNVSRVLQESAEELRGLNGHA
jgi:PAS domain S-box-containing protein|tara:strand:- start:4380 stop:4862 length:483 start_codon:yes stop_codon:yes gene_type:complete